MFNPKDILPSSLAARALGQLPSVSVGSPLKQSVPSVSVESVKNASQIVGGVQQVSSLTGKQLPRPLPFGRIF
jgi:hypothetical protein